MKEAESRRRRLATGDPTDRQRQEEGPAANEPTRMATLLFKVGALTLKTVSKPLATKFEQYVMGHPTLRKQVIAAANFLHGLEVSITRGAEGKTGKVFVGSMSEENAVQMASKVASESFVYGTALVLLVAEMMRKDKEDKEKKAKAEGEQRRREEVEQRLQDELVDVKLVLSKLEARFLDIESSMERRRAQLAAATNAAT